MWSKAVRMLSVSSRKPRHANVQAENKIRQEQNRPSVEEELREMAETIEMTENAKTIYRKS